MSNSRKAQQMSKALLLPSVTFPGGKDLAKGFHALVNTANCVGIMGKGIMIKFKE
jgi:hypothetical protein